MSHEPYEKPNLLPSWKILTCFFSQRNWYRSWNSSVRTNVAKQIWKKTKKNTNLWFYNISTNSWTWDIGQWKWNHTLSALSLSLSSPRHSYRRLLCHSFRVSRHLHISCTECCSQGLQLQENKTLCLQLQINETEVLRK